MITKTSTIKKELYRTPSVKVIVVSSENIICTSGDGAGTEGFSLNDYSYADGDFE